MAEIGAMDLSCGRRIDHITMNLESVDCELDDNDRREATETILASDESFQCVTKEVICENDKYGSKSDHWTAMEVVANTVVQQEANLETNQDPLASFAPTVYPPKSQPLMDTVHHEIHRCKKCDTVCPSRVELERHASICGNKGSSYRSECPLCGESFSTRSQFNAHVRSHNNDFKCTVCNKTFLRRNELDLHIATHVQFPCRVCRKSFNSEESRDAHIENLCSKFIFSVLPVVKPFRCSVCRVAFLTRLECEKHLDLHSIKFPYECYQCDDTVVSIADHLKHQRKVIIAKTLTKGVPKCHTCFAHFTSVCMLKQHMLLNHSTERRYICAHCVKPFPTKGILLSHYNKTHTKKPNPFAYSCALCNMVFGNKRHVSVHLIHFHNQELRYKCRECGEVFEYKKPFEEHLLHMHGGCVCQICGCTLPTVQSLHSHIRRHMVGGHHKCTECPMVYNSNDHLKEHLETHGISETATQVWSCDFCPKTFSQHFLLELHVRIHLGHSQQLSD